MRILPSAVVVFAAVSVAGCERSTFVQPEHQDATLAFSRNSAAAAVVAPGKPEIDPTYANGTTVYMIGPHLIENARATMPNAYAHAEELYLVTYPQASLPLSSGYQPQCNPCFHPGLPAPFVFHDHVITGAPGMGVNGTAGAYKAPWKMIVLVYNPAYIALKTFKLDHQCGRCRRGRSCGKRVSAGQPWWLERIRNRYGQSPHLSHCFESRLTRPGGGGYRRLRLLPRRAAIWPR